MKAVLRTIRNYVFYCGIEKDEYNALKKDAYISNFNVWRILHILMTAVFTFLYISSLFHGIMQANRVFYLSALIYSAITMIYFFIAKKDSLIAQFIIYLSISVLFLFACFITQNKPDTPATTFIALLLITPMFMIDKPFFMTIELSVASAVFLIWMYRIKPYDVWQLDLVNVIVFTIVGVFLHFIANAIRIKEFVLTRTIIIQKDVDEMTGLKNKGALTREINAVLTDEKADKGVMMLLDVDTFKSINDTFGHDTGDRVIEQVGDFLREKSFDEGIVGRFGGDEFIVFIKDTDDPELAVKIAGDIAAGVSEHVTLPDDKQKISVSIGIATYSGEEKNYSDLLKKADIALYRSKADPLNRVYLYE